MYKFLDVCKSYKEGLIKLDKIPGINDLLVLYRLSYNKSRCRKTFELEVTIDELVIKGR